MTRRNRRPPPLDSKNPLLEGLRVDLRLKRRLPKNLRDAPDLLEGGGMARADKRARPGCSFCGDIVDRPEQVTVFFCRPCLDVVGPTFLSLPAASLSFGAQVQDDLSVPLPEGVAATLGIGPSDEVRWILSAQGLMLQAKPRE
jgi:hypothetical protein